MDSRIIFKKYEKLKMFGRMVFFKIGIFINVIGTRNCRVEDVPRDVESLMKTDNTIIR